MMNIKECYACIGANWQEVYERFGCNEAIVKKFAIKFLEDPSFHDMKKRLQREIQTVHFVQRIH